MINWDDLKVLAAGGTGLSASYLPIQTGLQIAVSCATLVFISLKTFQLIKKNGKKQ